ncbi:ligase-associated DNA damage response DEXH box helicase [Psychroflexus maritimus]|uniref:Ligase-associated DNA damage response DEXH box helicase n=1 Tax=Psychroflexus maritimus TaxID=2714865 RepID=A0A967DZB6_9FLAO|nr:ligase-associated DNA damage response DEXH box helicase [Psychroflexus maritimus]NGZ90755.1 ligase-associated DNA damage response DEXH box helicase [Psychroflexus maritimus]
MSKFQQQISAWLSEKDWELFNFQKQAWEAFRKNKNGLVNAPTGSGKTFSLALPILEQLTQTPKKGLQVLWITPLRALSVEIKNAFEKVIFELELPLTVDLRTGDTSASQRAKQKRKMPNILITTPESLHLLLASKNYPKTFQHLEALVVDEWHELLGTKRGVQVELALSRLKTIAQRLKIWGISATIGNLELGMQVLLGHELKNSTLIKAKLQKKIEVKSIIPKEMEKFPWRGHLGLHLLEDIIPIIKNSKSTLIFTNTRSQCEIWFQKILEKYPEFAGELAMHHGSINKETRLWVENAIRNESLKAVVCTSSLDLGVDFAPVESIIQIGGPKGVARFLQRAGRSGHQPNQVSKIYFLPTHAIELIEASALQKAVLKNEVEDRLPYLNSFDVLVQYLTTLAVSEGFYPAEILPEIQSTFCFQTINENQWNWALNYIVFGGESLKNYDDYKKVEISSNGKYQVQNRGVAMRHRLQIGTIVSDAVLQVKYLKGSFIGSIEEWFISKLQPGDVFTFAGRNLELVRIKGMQVLVRKSTKKTAKVPSWMGGRLSLSSEMSHLLREELYQAKKYATPELKALQPIFELQEERSHLPQANEFLIETFETREGFHQLFYPFEGRFVHEAMASLIAYRISLLSPISFSLAFNDYGFELLSDQPVDMQQVMDNNLFSSAYLLEDLKKSLNATEMARRKFRDIAVIAGLVFTGYPNKSVKQKHLQSSSQLIFDVFKDVEPEHLLYQQAFVETFEYSLEQGRLQQAMERIHQQEIIWKNCEQPTPFSFPIITDRLREKLSSEKLQDRIQKMIKQLQK